MKFFEENFIFGENRFLKHININQVIKIFKIPCRADKG